MKIDWFDFWIFFSAILLFFFLLALAIRIYHWFSFRKELSYIKDKKIKDIVDTNKKLDIGNESLGFKKEMDVLMKDVCFGLYDKSNNFVGNDDDFDFESALEKLLDGKILETIKEKDLLLVQKDSVIGSIENRNKLLLKEVMNKTFFMLKEKDKMLAEKDSMISYLKMKIQEIALIDMNPEALHKALSGEKNQRSSDVNEKNNLEKEKKSHDYADFLNVNDFLRK